MTPSIPPPRRPSRPHRLLSSGLVLLQTDDGSPTLFDPNLSESFHSESGAAAESYTVFLENSGVAARLQAGKATQILEIGFGTGLNFLLTAGLALQTGCPLRYVGLDPQLLDLETWQELDFARWIQSPELLQAFQNWLTEVTDRPPDPFFPVLTVGPVSFEFHRQTAERWLDDQESPPIPSALSTPSEVRHEGTVPSFDVIYHDAFSPEVAGPLWTADFFLRLLPLLPSNGCLATYCVKSEIQRRLREVGFRVQKRPGPPGGKREVLVAFNSIPDASLATPGL